MPYTCTSTHPVKALWFALECFFESPDNAVVYIAKTENLQQIETDINVLGEIENEIGFIIKPVDFYKYCDAYIKVQDLQAIFKQAGWDAYQAVRKDNITRICEETPRIKVDEIKILVKKMRPYLKIV